MREVPTHQTRPIWAEVSTSRLVQNLYTTQAIAGDQIDLLAVVKADAYGHGAVECAPVLVAAGAKWLGVTSVEEGIAVRRALGILPQGVMPRILVMCGVWLGEAEACIAHRLTPTVWDPLHLDLLEEAARKQNLPAHRFPVHLEIDTGMSRQGVFAGAPLEKLLERLAGDTPLMLEGVMTHLASAEDTAGTQNGEQEAVFRRAVLQAARLRPTILHAGNTSAVDGVVVQPWLPQLAESVGARAMTRTGLALYGYAMPLTLGDHQLHLAPVLTWKTRVISLRHVDAGTHVGYSGTFTAQRLTRLALLPVGYADGFRRSLSSVGSVLIHGQRVPIAGRVAMDLTVVDVTDLPKVQVGDEVVVLGSQGEQQISAEEHAMLAQTISYEILCGISDRVPRILVD